MDGREQAGAVFVGRQHELGMLLEGLDSAVAGRGRLILLAGEPGIGKSRLADELARVARERGLSVLWGRGWEDAGAPAYWPWVQALRAELRAESPDTIRGFLGSGAADVAQMLPELRTIVPGTESSATGSETARFQLFDATTTFLRNAARERGLLVVLDDLQAADTPSVLLLQFVASQLSDMRILLVATYRDVELTPEHPLTSALAELAREPAVRVIQLGGLDADAVAEVIGATVGTTPNDRLAAVVLRATNGNPLFIGEAVRLLESEGRLEEVGDGGELRVAIPAGVHAVIARRIGYLGAPTVDALRLGSALGPEFSLEALGRVGDIAGDQVLDVIDEAIEAGLLLPVGGARGRYRFSHDIVRETLYDELSPGRRVRLHRRIADILETMYGPGVAEHLAELAFHFVQATIRPDGSGAADDTPVGRKAIEYARRAGDQATAALAYEEAARLYRMALTVMALGGMADDQAQTETLLALGDVQTRTGDLDSARTTFLEASEIARRTGDGPHLARAALGFGGRHQWARPGSDVRLIPLLQDALVLLGGQDETLRARLLTRLACAWRSSPERRIDSDSLSREAIDIARRLDDPATLVYTLTGRFWATWWPENPGERQAIAREVLSIAEPLRDGERIADAHFMAYLTLSELGLIHDARAALVTLARVIEEVRQPAQVWLAPVNRSALALIAGDYAEAEESVANEARSQFWITPGRDEVSAARMHRFLLRREQGRVAEEEATVRQSIVDFPWYPMFRSVLVCLLLDAGREAEARTEFADLARNAFAALYRDNAWLFGMSLAAEACARLGETASAVVLLEQLAPFAGRHAIAHAEGSVGVVDRYLGLLAAAIGRLDEAEHHLTAAIELNDGMGARPWTAHCEHDLAGVLRRRGAPPDAGAATALDRRALATARALGMALEAEIAPADPVEAVPSEIAARSAEFRREGEYWSIVFELDAFRVRDSRGMRHLGRLLRTPGDEVHALELTAPPSAPVDRASLVEADVALAGSDDAGPALDAEAKAAYRTRLIDLREELAEAESWNDPERVARLQAEQDALARELGAALGIGGRDRPTGSPSERARISATRAIRAAMTRIADQSPALGAHLEATIRTGTYCAYVPDPHAPIDWRF